MKVPERIVVVGNSTAGITVANKLRTRISRENAEIILISGGNRHYFNDASVFVPVNFLQTSQLSAPIKGLIKNSIVFVNENVKMIDIESKGVTTDDGHLIRYTYLVLAGDFDSAHDTIPGFIEEARSVNAVQNAIALREDIESLKSGTIVIGNAQNYMGNETLISDLAIVISNDMKRRKQDTRVKVQVFFPEAKIHGSNELYKHIEAVLTENNIEVVSGFNLASVNVKNKELVSTDGKTIKYNLPIIMPPESLDRSIISSNIPKDDSGKIKFDLDTLSVSGHEDIFTIGGSLNLHGSQTISTALDQAEFVSAFIANRISGYRDPGTYEFKIQLQPILNSRSAETILISGEDLVVGKPSETDFLMRLYAHSSYLCREIRGFI